MIRQRAISILVAAITVALIAAPACAERVGYSFEGVVEPFFSQTATLFGVQNISLPASISGAFSYDTTSQPVYGSSGTVSYAQSIDAGFTLNVDGETLQLSLNNFKINVTNDFHRMMPVETVDTVDIRFDSTDPLTPGPIDVNGQPWTGTALNFIVLELTYPVDTLTDAGLPTALPQTFSTGIYSGLGSDHTALIIFRITSLSPISFVAGDYNADGKLDGSDFQEWRDVFGETSESARYADGNGDGIVDGADYVILRHAMAVAGSGNTLAIGAVPEPAGLMLAVVALAGMLMCGRRPDRCHLPSYLR